MDERFSVQLPIQPTEKDWKKALATQGHAPTAEQLEKLQGMKLVSATDGVANYALSAARGIISTPLKPGKAAVYYNGGIKGLMSKEQGTLVHRSTAIGEECWGEWASATEVPVLAFRVCVA